MCACLQVSGTGLGLPPASGASRERARRLSSMDAPALLQRDVSLGRGRLLLKPAAASPVDVAGMSLKTLLSDPSLAKTFVRFVLHREGACARACVSVCALCVRACVHA